MKKMSFLDYINILLIVLIILSLIYVCRNNKHHQYAVIDSVFLSMSSKSNYIVVNNIVNKKENDIIPENNNTKVKNKLNNQKQLHKDDRILIEDTGAIKKEKEENEVKNNDTNTEEENNENNEILHKNVLETLNGSLAGYGPDCSGCSSKKTSSGYYIGEGNIYYNDKEFGKVRIVAGDKKYPFGTIVKITNSRYYDNAPIYSIVLDRGGVGIGKKYIFDLLFNSEEEASNFGSKKNVTFEILRLGF